MRGFKRWWDLLKRLTRGDHEARVDQFLLENVQNEIFEIFKMFKNSS